MMLEQPFQDSSVLRQLTALRDLSQKALTARNTDELLERGVKLLEEVFHTSLARIWLVQPDGTLILKASVGITCPTVESGCYTINPKEFPYKLGRVARTLEPYVSNQIPGDEEFDQAWIERE